jgi:hypothetical protein
MLTMAELTAHIDTFGATISRQPLRLAKYCPDVAAQPTSCFENVRRKVEQAGGMTQFGWMFNYRVVENIPGPGYLMAIHHAVWAAPDGMLIDVTPFHAHPLHHPLGPGRGVVFFLVDDAATLPEFAPLENRLYPLTSEQRLFDHIERLRKKEEEECRQIHERNKRENRGQNNYVQSSD